MRGDESLQNKDYRDNMFIQIPLEAKSQQNTNHRDNMVMNIDPDNKSLHYTSHKSSSMNLMKTWFLEMKVVNNKIRTVKWKQETQ